MTEDDIEIMQAFVNPDVGDPKNQLLGHIANFDAYELRRTVNAEDVLQLFPYFYSIEALFMSQRTIIVREPINFREYGFAAPISRADILVDDIDEWKQMETYSEVHLLGTTFLQSHRDLINKAVGLFNTD